MPVDYEHLNRRLDSLREELKAHVEYEFRRRETERSIRLSNAYLVAMCLAALVFLTVMITLEAAT